MSVYAGELPSNLDEALASLCACDEQPMEVVLVEDGPLTPGLETVIDQYRGRLPVVSVKLPTLLVSVSEPTLAIVGFNNTLVLSLLTVNQLARSEELPVTPYLAALLLIKF